MKTRNYLLQYIYKDGRLKNDITSTNRSDPLLVIVLICSTKEKLTSEMDSLDLVWVSQR